MVKYEDFTVGDIQSHSQWNVCRGQVQSVKPEERNRAEPTSRSRHVTNTFSFCHQTWTHRVLNDEQERSTWGDGNHTVGLWTRHNSELNQRQHSPVGGTSGGRTRTLGFCGAVEAGPCGQTVYWWRTPGPEGREEPGSQHTEPESGAPEPPSEEEENNVRTTDEIELGFIFYWILTGSKCGLRPSSCPRDNMVENGPRFFINHSVLELDPFTQPGPGVWWNEQKIFWLNDETDVKAALWLVGPAQTWLRFGQEGEQEVLQHHAPLFQTHSLKVVDEHLQPGYNDDKKNPEWENILELSVEVLCHIADEFWSLTPAGTTDSWSFCQSNSPENWLTRTAGTSSDVQRTRYRWRYCSSAAHPSTSTVSSVRSRPEPRSLTGPLWS